MANNQLFEQLLGPISPIAKDARDDDSVSLRHLQQENTGYTAQSRPRAAFGAVLGDRANLQSNFEFGRPAAKGGALGGDFKPFAALSSQQYTAQTPSAAPTPASVTACTDVGGGATPMSATPSSVGAASAAATPLPASTPAPSLSGAPVTAAPRTSWGDVLLWRDPLSSAFLFALGLGVYFTAAWAMRGGAPVTPTSAVAYLLLAHLGINFLRFFCSARWHAACLWEGSASADAAAEAAVRMVRRASALHDAYLSSKDPHVTLAVVLSLWTLAWLGSALSANQLLLLGYLGAFFVPALYVANRTTIDAGLSALHHATLGRIDAMEMPRTTRLLVLLAGLLTLLVCTTWAQFAIGALAAATYWRTTLAPAEIEAIRTVAEPLTHDVTASVRKVRARLSVVLDDARAMCSTAGPASRTAPRTRKAHAG